ncbi:TlpA family protein disulfide reductase [Halpernia sp.]|uniref:TlpA family protein disulfide reductase n=1 Tax=Halpernia sp. TaxID=2782209 RepID=UPI003A8CD37D
MKNFTLFIFTFLSIGLFAQNSKIYPKGKIILGEENTFIYEPRKGISVPEGSEVKFVTIVQQKSSPLIKSQNKYEFKIKVPDSIRTIVLSVFDKNENLFDNNFDKGYISILNKSDKSKAELDKLALLQNQASYFYKLKYSKQYYVNQYEKLFKSEPKLKEKPENIFYYLEALFAADEKKAETESLIIAKKLENKNDEKSLMTSRDFYQNFLKDSQKATTLSTLILKKYPKGNFAKNMLMDKFRKEAKEADVNTLMQYVSDYKNNYPSGEYDKILTDQMNAVILSKIIESKDWSKIEDFTKRFNCEMNAANVFNLSAWKLADGDDITSDGKDLEFAEKLARKSVDILDNKLNNLGKYEEKSEYNDQYLYYTDALALVLYKEKKYDQAFLEQSKIIDLTNIDDTNRERYVLYAQKAKGDDFVKNYIYNLLKKQNISEKLFTTLSDIYKTENLQTAEINNLKESNKKIETKKSQEKLLKLYSGNLKAKDFELTNLQGQKVKLSDFKGKIVVLDFWATWCGPCRAALPHMQELVKKYDKSEVQFLFINTMEREKPDEIKKKVSKFIADNKYDLNVLYDFDNSAYKNYLIDGIPCEIIIDKNGNLISRSLGYDSNLEALINENK